MFYLPQLCALVPPLCKGLKIRSSKQLKANLNGASACPFLSASDSHFHTFPSTFHLPLPHPHPHPSHTTFGILQAASLPQYQPLCLIQINTQRSHNQRGLCPCAPAPCTPSPLRFSPLYPFPTLSLCKCVKRRIICMRFDFMPSP